MLSSPNPKNPPLYVDLPLGDSASQQVVLARWAANAPLAFVDQYIGNLKQYNGIAIDVGDQDGLRADTEQLHDALERYGVAHTFEIYEGTHTSAKGRSLPEQRAALLQPAAVHAAEVRVTLRVGEIHTA